MATWQPPESYRFMAIFAGETRNLAGFMQVWLRWGGALDLDMGTLEPVTLPQNGFPPRPSVVAAVPVELAPSHYVVEWWLEQPNWHLFYQPRPALDTDAPAPRPAPTGVYLEWGVEATPYPTGPTAVQWKSGHRTPLPATYRNLCEYLEKGPVIFDPPDRDRLRRSEIAGLNPDASPYSLQVMLGPPLPEQKFTNPRAELNRIRKRINDLTEQAATLEWQLGERDVHAEVCLYRETPEQLMGVGTHWDLRNWYLTAPDAAVAEFAHARVNLPGAGVFHVVRPKDLLRPTRCSLPLPAFRLRLDRRWFRFEERKVFVSEGLTLYPGPPELNHHVRRLLEDSLWEGHDPREMLMLLADGDRHLRFAVPESEFTPMADSLGKLNLQVALESPVREPEPDALRLIFEESRAALAATIDAHASAMKKILDNIWNGDRGNLERYRAQVAAALEHAAAIQAEADRIDKFRTDLAPILARDWKDWANFLDSLLAADRGALPSQRAQLAEWLQDLDVARSTLSSGWLDPQAMRKSPGPAAKVLAVYNKLTQPIGGRP